MLTKFADLVQLQQQICALSLADLHDTLMHDIVHNFALLPVHSELLASALVPGQGTAVEGGESSIQVVLAQVLCLT